MTTADIPFPVVPTWDERRVREIERAIEKIKDDNQQAVLLVEVRELRKRVDRMATFAMAASGLLVAVLGFLLKVLTG